MPTTDAARAPDRTPVTLFYSYAHEDEDLRDELQRHLTILERRGVIRSWHDRAITAGSDWGHEIDQRLHTADVVLLLISTDFIASDYIFGVELDVAMQRQRSGDAVVVPILLRDVDLQPEDADRWPFVKLQGLPRDWKPVTSWSNRDEAWTNVARGLRETVRVIQDRRAAASSNPRATEPAPPSAPRNHGPMLARVTDDFTQQIAQANAARGGATVDAAELQRQAMQMIDMPELKCVLWVDDHPERHVAECTALAKLQIEVAAVRSTDEALARLADAAARDDRFDLVISDWNRLAEGPLAGLRVLRAMRAGGHAQPVVFYHGAVDATKRAERAAGAREAGAFGEAVMPAELMQLVMTALCDRTR